ncbi:MAG: hypothetical protein V9H25_00690 [Candidatus Competibacter sp.]
MRDDYDSPWKEVLERYFPAFLAWFFPAAHADIAWEHGYRFLDKELQKVVRDAKLGRRWADKLVQVTTRDGGEDWLLVHVEVQGQREADFARRMFSYNYRLFDRYARPVVSLAVLGEGQGETAGQFGYGRWGGETRFTFPVVCLNDYRDRQAEMMQIRQSLCRRRSGPPASASHRRRSRPPLPRQAATDQKPVSARLGAAGCFGTVPGYRLVVAIARRAGKSTLGGSARSRGGDTDALRYECGTDWYAEGNGEGNGIGTANVIANGSPPFWGGVRRAMRACARADSTTSDL